jgi:1-deoxy-D-xylulose-5-phosphate reductoisomerase
MKRVALLGATGSIGRQAIEIVEAHPDLELCAAASGTTPLDEVDAPLKEVGGDLTELLERAQPDVVLAAAAGFSPSTASTPRSSSASRAARRSRSTRSC